MSSNFPQRQPPRFVPTLTQVVTEEATRSAAATREEAPSALSDEQCVALASAIRQTLEQEVERLLPKILETELKKLQQSLALQIFQVLENPIAQAVDTALQHALRAPKNTIEHDAN